MSRKIIAGILLSLAAATSQAALLGRAALTPGGSDYQAYYDDVLNITWLADANAGAGSIYDDGNSATDGRMTWYSAQAWIGSLNTANYLGASTWRLPTIIDTGTSGCNYATTSTDCGYNVDLTTSEMAHMFYSTLGNLGAYNTSSVGPQAGWGLTNDGPFSNLQPDAYWSGTTYAPRSIYAWYFDFYDGFQYSYYKTDTFYAWAVSPGDMLAPVPIPATAWLLGTGIAGLGGRRLMRRKIRS